MSEDLVKVGRLALRQEGELWVAYYADHGTMEGAIYLGSVIMALVENKHERREQFIAFMREVIADIIEKKVGVRPSWPEGTQPAPEHERGQTVPNPYLR